MQVLLLNASYEPLTTVSWKRAMTLVLTGRAEIIERRDRTIRSSGGFEMPFPAVVKLVKMAIIPRTGTVPLTRRALAARDGGKCQVVGCDDKGDTIDHVLPRSRGGQHVWTNVVLMCSPHNSNKDDRTLDELGWELKSVPRAPVAQVALVAAVVNDPLLAQWAGVS